MSKNSARLLPLVLVAGGLAFLYPLWSGQGILYSGHSDLIAQGAGLRALETRTLHEEGRWPLWDPSCNAGSPAHANPLTTYASPLHWPFLFLPLDRAANWVLILNTLLAGLAMWTFARRFLETPEGALFCGFSYMLAYRYLALLDAGWLPTVTMYALFPLLLWACDRLLARPDGRTAAAFSIILALSAMQGSAQSFYYALLALGAFALRQGALLPRRDRARAALAFLGAGLVAALLAAPDLLPRAEFAALSTRTSFDYRFFLGDPPRLADLATWLDPRDAGGTRFEYWENNFYFGLYLYPLALWACWKDGKRARVLLAALAVLLFLCFDSPVLRFLFDHFPGFALFRRSTRLLQLAQAALVALAGLGVDSLLRRAPRGRRLAAAAALCALPFLDAGVRMLPRLETLPLSDAFPPAPFGDMLKRSPLRGRVAAVGRTAVPYGVASYYGIDMVNGYEPLNLKHYVEYFSVLQTGDARSAPRSPVVWSDLRTIAKPEMLRALDAEFVVANATAPLEAVGWKPVGRTEATVFEFYRGLVRVPVYLWRDSRRLGPAYFAKSLAEAADERASLEAVARSTSPLDAYVLGWRGGPAFDFSGGTVAMTRRGQNVYEYVADSRGENFLILSQVWYPGWRATLDGLPVELSRVNHALIGLAVPPGRHALRLEMTSPMLNLGLLLFAAGAAILVALQRLDRHAS